MIWRSEEHMKDLNPRKKYLNFIYRMKLLTEDQAQGFESPLVGNSNSTLEMRILELWIQISFLQVHLIWSEWLITPDFKGFLSHNG